METSRADRRAWSIAVGGALVGHLAVAALVLAWTRQQPVPEPEPIVELELPALPAPADQPAVADQPVQPDRQTLPDQPAPNPPLDIPPVRAPLPINPVTLPPVTSPQPQRQPAPAAPTKTSAAPSAPSAVAPPSAVSTDPRALKQQADYFALISAHLNRRKTYPVEARQARQQGVVVVRFTVDRNGNVSGVAIKRSSGHDILDQATLALVQRVAPLPRMPVSMQRESITLALPIDYSLRTD